MKIKVCGLTEPDNIKAVAGLHPDYIGHIFYRRSPRYFEAIKYPETDPEIQRTGVFVNEEKGVINAVINTYKMNAVQLHGNESPEFCAYFKKTTAVIKAFGIYSGFDFNDLKYYQEHVNFFLFDTDTNKYGGSGTTFNWKQLYDYQLDTPFFISGGLSLDNLDQAKTLKHPQLYGVDLNSKFENSPGIKDINKLEIAFELINSKL